MKFVVYILWSEKRDRYYVGQAEDLDRRLARHNAGLVRSTKVGAPWIPVYVEDLHSRKEAIAREREIKSRKSRRYIEQLNYVA